MPTSTVSLDERDDGSIAILVDGVERHVCESGQEAAMFAGLCLTRIDDLERLVKGRDLKRRVEAVGPAFDRVEWIDVLIQSMSGAARSNFNRLERKHLYDSMTRCGMSQLPEPTGDLDGTRASGLCICEHCGHQYYDHPSDWRAIEHGDRPCLHILCDGTRVKL